MGWRGARGWRRARGWKTGRRVGTEFGVGRSGEGLRRSVGSEEGEGLGRSDGSEEGYKLAQSEGSEMNRHSVPSFEASSRISTAQWRNMPLPMGTHEVSANCTGAGAGDAGVGGGDASGGGEGHELVLYALHPPGAFPANDA